MNNINNINPIFEALSGVDERHIPVKKTKRPIKKVIIAAAAAAAIGAAVSVIAGFKPSERGDRLYTIEQEGVPAHTFELNLASCHITVPEEYVPKDDTYLYCSNKEMDMSPRELYEMFGLTPPLNDNFTDIPDEKPKLDFYYSIDDFPEYDIYSEHSELIQAGFHYVQYNKSIDRKVYFRAMYEEITGGGSISSRSTDHLFPGEPSELITLKDGSRGLITKWRAIFAYEGASYEILLDYDFTEPDGYGELSIDEQYRVINEMIEAMPGIDAVKQVLVDLDLL